MDEQEAWIAGFDVPRTLQEAEVCWRTLREQEEEIAHELQEYRDLRRNDTVEIEEMQRRYTRRLGSSNVTQKINQNISKLFADSKKLSKLTTENLNKFYLWKEEVKGLASIADLVYGSSDPQVYTTWLWNSLDEELRGLCMNMDPILNPNMPLDEYLMELEKTLKPDGFYGLARFIFESQQQRVTEPITAYWERVYTFITLKL